MSTRPATRAATATLALAVPALVALTAQSAPATPPATSTAAVAAPHPAAAAPRTTSSAPKDMVDLADVDPTILRDIRYRTDHDFVGRPVAGYVEARCLLTRAAATHLAQVQRALRPQGYGLKVYDCYRPQRAVNDFVAWAKTSDQRMKREFYPRVDKSTLFAKGYIAARSGHSHGSTMDLTIVKLPAKKQPAWTPRLGLKPCHGSTPATRFPDNTIDMGTGFDCFDVRAHTDNPYSTPTQRANRELLRSTMRRFGFINYDQEWWHYTLNHEPYPKTFFDFPIARSSLRR